MIKSFYYLLLNHLYKIQVDLEQIIENENWNLYYETAMKNVLNTKLQTFQYTINFIY
jgi:hypothetical protein